MRLPSIFRSRRGSIDMIPDFGGSIILFAIMLSVALSALGVMALKASMDNAAWHVCRMIEVDGTYDAAEQQKVAAYLSEIHLGAQVSVSPVQDTYDLDESFTVTLSFNAKLGGGGAQSLALPVYGRASGISEVYQK